jgi:hypothetical protein
MKIKKTAYPYNHGKRIRVPKFQRAEHFGSVSGNHSHIENAIRYIQIPIEYP